MHHIKYPMKITDCELLIVDGGPERDGLGVEIWHKDKLILEIFRDDEKKLRTMTSYQDDLPLELIESGIEIFKNRIPK